MGSSMQSLDEQQTEKADEENKESQIANPAEGPAPAEE